MNPTKSKFISILILCLFFSVLTYAQNAKVYEVKSPNGAIVMKIEAGARLQWSVQHKGQQIIAPSVLSLILQNGEVLGDNAKITPKTESVKTTINTINYVKSIINDVYNQVTLNCKGDYGVIFRAYDDAIAYRFFTKMPGEIIIKNEEANFNFTEDHNAFIPMQWDYRDGKMFNSSYENTYKEIKLSRFPKDSLAFLPVLVDVGQNKKAELFEVDLEDYPGMYVDLNQTGKGFKGVFAQYPLEIE
ncbi:MAG TPA: glycoside hydrolase family 97 N-terminal domain-containing protein, partial [Prolixibacteraceae bacterium]